MHILIIHNNVLFYVIFLQIGVHSPLQSKEHNTVKMYTHTHTKSQQESLKMRDFKDNLKDVCIFLVKRSPHNQKEEEKQAGRQTDRPPQTAEDCRCCHHQQNKPLPAPGVWSLQSVSASSALHFSATPLEVSASLGLCPSSSPFRQRGKTV